MSVKAVVLVAALTALPLARPAAAAGRNKIAALVLGAGAEAELADNLTEVLIARIAKSGDFEIVGKEEFRSRLGVTEERRTIACIEDPACVGRAGAALGVTKVLAGTVGRRGADYVFSLSLYDLETARTENQTFKLVSGGVPALIAAVSEAAIKIFERRPELGDVRVTATTPGAHVYVDDAFVGTTPVRSPRLESGRHRLRVEAEGHLGWARAIDVPAGRTLDIELGAQALPAQRTWPRYLAWVTFGAAIAAAGAGGFLGVLSQEAPTGSTRREQLADVDHKDTQASIANVLFAGAGALAITSGVTFIAFRRDIFGGEASVSAAASPRGMQLALRW
jgi:hypothetical protein